MSDYFKSYPFVAVTGQEQAKRAILIALVNHKAGGLLISGVTGTAKSVLVRGAAELSGDRKLLNLPLNVTEDMLFGSIDLEYAVTQGERRFEPGLLGRADGNIIYIDEVNLLRPELLTAVLDINMAGENRVERDGISFVHKTEYTVIGTMDPHEGVLPNHLLDRFGLFVETENLKEKEQRRTQPHSAQNIKKKRNSCGRRLQKHGNCCLKLKSAMPCWNWRYNTVPRRFAPGTERIYIYWKQRKPLRHWREGLTFCPKIWKKRPCMYCRTVCASPRNPSRKNSRLRKSRRIWRNRRIRKTMTWIRMTVRKT